MIELTDTLPRQLIEAGFALYEKGTSFCLHHNHNHRRNTLVDTFPVSTTSVLQIANIAEQHLELCEPKIGRVARGNEIGKASRNKYTFHACTACGEPRWVEVRKGKVRSSMCCPCSHLESRCGSYKNGKGYIYIRLFDDSPFFPMVDSRGYVAAHRLAMAKHLGRCLHSWEWVRIKNHDRADVRVENLRLEQKKGRVNPL